MNFFDHQLSNEASAQPETFIDRMKTIETKAGKSTHVSVERDNEFAVCVARAQQAKPAAPRAPAKVSRCGSRAGELG